MEFDWSLYRKKDFAESEVAESFEDPFSVRLMPDSGEIANQSRFFCIGKSLKQKGIFSLYATNGKQVRIITSREMTEAEEMFYQRKIKEDLT
ncbi:MAG: hypothetical protein AAF984_08130 [Verrucomicrobiota bacterium]